LIRIRPWRANRDAQKFIQQLEPRFREVGKVLAWQSAMFVLEEVIRRLPPGRYRNSLELVEVGEGSYAIQAKSKAKKVSEVDAEATVLYVRPKSRRAVRLHPEIGVLAQYSPWTMDTLPFFPSRRYAKVISRTVRRSELDAVKEDRKRDESLWKSELQRLGIRPEVKLSVSPKARVLPDVAFEALRIEFGLGGKQSRAHWRPALRALAREGIPRMLSQRSPTIKPVASLRYATSLLPTDGSITMTEAADFVAFEKRLKVKIRERRMR
jgi:hypothetical protein